MVRLGYWCFLKLWICIYKPVLNQHFKRKITLRRKNMKGRQLESSKINSRFYVKHQLLLLNLAKHCVKYNFFSIKDLISSKVPNVLKCNVKYLRRKEILDDSIFRVSDAWSDSNSSTYNMKVFITLIVLTPITESS